MTDSKKKIALISFLAAIFVALVLVYIFVIVPMTEEDPKVKEPIYVAPGEGLYNNTMITVYPEIDKSKIEYLEINNEHGTYSFHNYYDSSMEREEMRLTGMEGIDYDKSMYALMIAYIYLPVSYQSNQASNAPMRNQTKEQMERYGVTEETCTASYTVGYRENGEMKYHTVYIGHPTFTSETTYYVALKGRNSVYRFHQEGVETCLYAPVEDYLSPLIYSKFESVAIAMVNINRFKIGISDPDRIGEDDYIKSIIEIVKTGQNIDGTSNMYDLLYKSLGTGKIVRTGASVEQLSAAFTAMYTYFAGDKVVAVLPTDKELEQYGLSIDDKCYFVTAQLSDKEEDIFTFRISEEIDGYYYTLSYIFGDKNPMVVRVPKVSLSFLNENDEEIFKWAGTDVSALFYEYLLRDDEAGEPGMSELVVRIQSKDDKTGEILYDIKEGIIIKEDGAGSVIATTDSGKRYESYINEEGKKENEFTDFYRILICFPNPTEFNNLNQEQIDALLLDDSAIVYQLIGKDNANGLMRYTFYQIGNSVDVMVETCRGQLVDGVEVWEEPQINFNTALSQVDIVRVHFQKLLNGEDLHPEDFIY